jgi:hypothetical protein
MKKWEKPKLVVMGRGMPEENVLTICKELYGAKSANWWQGLCVNRRTDAGCPDCKRVVTS